METDVFDMPIPRFELWGGGGGYLFWAKAVHIIS